MRGVFPALALFFATAAGKAQGEAAPLAEEASEQGSRTTLSLLGGGGFPVGTLADTHALGLAARAVLAFTGESGLGLGLSVGYSPLPAANLEAGLRRENHLGYAAMAPRFTLGEGVARLFVGAGGAVLHERSVTERPTTGESSKDSMTEFAAIGEAGLELHFADAGGLTLGGAYVVAPAGERPQLAIAQAGFVISF